MAFGRGLLVVPGREEAVAGGPVVAVVDVEVAQVREPSVGAVAVVGVPDEHVAVLAAGGREDLAKVVAAAMK